MSHQVFCIFEDEDKMRQFHFNVSTEERDNIWRVGLWLTHYANLRSRHDIIERLQTLIRPSELLGYLRAAFSMIKAKHKPFEHISQTLGQHIKDNPDDIRAMAYAAKELIHHYYIYETDNSDKSADFWAKFLCVFIVTIPFYSLIKAGLLKHFRNNQMFQEISPSQEKLSHKVSTRLNESSSNLYHELLFNRFGELRKVNKLVAPGMSFRGNLGEEGFFIGTKQQLKRKTLRSQYGADAKNRADYLASANSSRNLIKKIIDRIPNVNINTTVDATGKLIVTAYERAEDLPASKETGTSAVAKGFLLASIILTVLLLVTIAIAGTGVPMISTAGNIIANTTGLGQMTSALIVVGLLLGELFLGAALWIKEYRDNSLNRDIEEDAINEGNTTLATSFTQDGAAYGLIPSPAMYQAQGEHLGEIEPTPQNTDDSSLNLSAKGGL